MSDHTVHGVFVTGTDTGIGKTVASAALLYRLRAAGTPARYWKPIQTGIEDDDDTATVARLSGCGPTGVLEAGVRLRRPLSPHLAARLAGTSITLEDVLDRAGPALTRGSWVVEGAGGVLVPVNDRDLMIDLMRLLGMPVVVVARTVLGTINHTLLTLEALAARGLTVGGVVMVGPPNDDNRAAIEHYGRTQVLGTLPMLASLTPETLQEAAAGLGELATLGVRTPHRNLPA
jgi:malonyl-CoA O-methyltransferase